LSLPGSSTVTELHLAGKLLALGTNIRFGKKWLKVTNTLAYRKTD